MCFRGMIFPLGRAIFSKQWSKSAQRPMREKEESENAVDIKESSAQYHRDNNVSIHRCSQTDQSRV